MEEDIISIIQRKIWTVEDILLKANELISKANELPEEVKKGLPRFVGDWSESNVKKYVEKLHDAVRDPIRYKNRKLLEDIGVQAKGISEEIFDNSLGIKEIVELFSELKELLQTVTNILIRREILLGWLKEGIDKTKEKLKDISDARTAFQRISGAAIDENLKAELIQRSAENTGFINSAEEIISKVQLIIEFEISVEYNGKFDEFNMLLIKVHDALRKLQEEYGMQKAEISELVKGKPLQKSHDPLNKKIEDCFARKSKLLEEWKLYSTTLRSIGCEVSEAPSGIHELEKTNESLRAQCLSKLGERGVRLLKFLKGENDFPEGISKKDIKNALVILRPLFAKFLREES